MAEMRKILLIFLLLTGINSSLLADSSGDLVREANDAYIRGEYSYAIELYEQVLKDGMVAAELYYNLGNAYYRNRQLGAAILNYERALRLQPSSEDILHNLQVARAQTVDVIEPVPLIFYERWWSWFLNLQPVDGWAISSILALVLFLAALSFYLFSRIPLNKKIAFAFSAAFLFVGILSLLAASKQYRYQHLQQEAIVFVPRITARSAPGENSPDLFVIHEGSKVRVTDQLGEWMEVRLANGNVGWVKRTALEMI